METKSLASKILVLGVDGMDPRLAKKMMDDGRMPNLKYLYEHGACREDMVMPVSYTHLDVYKRQADTISTENCKTSV